MATNLNFENSALVVFPVEFVRGGYAEDPHVTLIYIPDTSTFIPGETEAQRKDLLVNTLKSVNLWRDREYRLFKTYGVKVFGPIDDQVPVLDMLDPATKHLGNLTNDIIASKEVYQGYLAHEDIKWSTDWDSLSKPYHPHITVSLHTAINPPDEVLLRPLEVWWHGKEKIRVYVD